MAIDYGSSRVGIAVSDPLCIIAQGIATLKNSSSLTAEISGLIGRYDPAALIIGMPLNLKGEKNRKAQEVETFIEKLKSIVTIEIIRWDERFTTTIAHRTMIEMGTTKKQRRTDKGRIDAMAAALILQSYLDQTKHSFSC